MDDEGARRVGGCEREVEGSVGGCISVESHDEVSQKDCIITLIRHRCEVSTICADVFDDASVH